MIKIGILGAAKIAPPAIIGPASRREDCAVVAVASRDPARARAFAGEHNIPDIADDYHALLMRPDIDLIYNALPPHRHADLSIAAMQAGKAVLCEKPFAMNAKQARAMVVASNATGQPLIEAFHYRFHPAVQDAFDRVHHPHFGPIRHIDAAFSVEILDQPDELRHTLDVGGGALMDLGCYPVHWARTLTGETPTVISAKGKEGRPGIDLHMTAHLEFPSGATATIQSSMVPGTDFKAVFEVTGQHSKLRMDNPLHPHRGYAINTGDFQQIGRDQDASDSTYDHQLAHVIDVIKNAADPMTGGADAIANMAVIDAIYRKAGFKPRGT